MKTLGQEGTSDSLSTKSLEGTESGMGRGVYLHLLSAFCSLGLCVSSCSPSTIKWEKQSREGGSHEGGEQDFYWTKFDTIYWYGTLPVRISKFT